MSIAKSFLINFKFYIAVLPHQIKNLFYDDQGLVVPAAVKERPAEADAEDVLPVVQLYRLLVAVHRGLPLLDRAEVLRLLPVGQASVRVVSAHNLTLENIKLLKKILRFLTFLSLSFFSALLS